MTAAERYQVQVVKDGVVIRVHNVEASGERAAVREIAWSVYGAFTVPAAAAGDDAGGVRLVAVRL